MKKIILLSLLVLYINLGKAQDCRSDIPRYSSYEYMEVYDYVTEKYNSRFEIKTYVIISSKDRSIIIKDNLNDYDKKFYILDCFLNGETIIYNCLDLNTNKKCSLKFSYSNDYYIMTVKYLMEKLMYRTKRVKNL